MTVEVTYKFSGFCCKWELVQQRGFWFIQKRRATMHTDIRYAARISRIVRSRRNWPFASIEHAKSFIAFIEHKNRGMINA